MRGRESARRKPNRLETVPGHHSVYRWRTLRRWLFGLGVLVIGHAATAEGVRLKGRIQQVLPGRKAALVEVDDRMVIVRPAPSGLYSGDQFNHWVERAGDAEYTTVLGAPTVVPGFRLLVGDEERAAENAADETERRRAARVVNDAMEKISRERDAELMRRADAARVAEEKRQKVAKKQAETDAKTSAFLRQRVQGGSVEAAYDLAVRLIEGKGVERDLEEARTLMVKASKKGHVEASKWLATNAVVTVEVGKETTPPPAATPSQGP